MILSFWLECFLDFYREVEISDFSKMHSDEIMIWYVN